VSYQPSIYSKDRLSSIQELIRGISRKGGDFVVDRNTINQYFAIEDLFFFWQKTNPDFEKHFQSHYSQLFKMTTKSYHAKSSRFSEKPLPLLFQDLARQTFSIEYIYASLFEYLQHKKDQTEQNAKKKSEASSLLKKATVPDRVSNASSKSVASESKSIKNFFTHFIADKSTNAVQKNPSSLEEIIQEDQDTTAEKSLEKEIENYLKFLGFLYTKKDNSGILFSDVPDSLAQTYFSKLLGVSRGQESVVELLSFDNSIAEKSHIKCLVQIENDIPRSHQYSYLMNSFYGKKHIYQLLTSWLNLNFQNTYTQGLDSIAIVVSEVCNWELDASVIMFDRLLKKFFPKITNHQETLFHLKTKIYLIEWILAYFEPSLALHLRKISFSSEIFAISWILTLYSSVFTIDKVKKIWEKMILMEDFQYLFAVSILCDLKSKLLLMDLNDCLSCIKSLEGIVDVDNCIKFAVMMTSLLSSNFFSIPYCSEEHNEDEYQNEFYSTRPWEVPINSVEVSNQRVFSISVFEMLALNKKPLVIDIRSEKE